MTKNISTGNKLAVIRKHGGLTNRQLAVIFNESSRSVFLWGQSEPVPEIFTGVIDDMYDIVSTGKALSIEDMVYLSKTVTTSRMFSTTKPKR